MCQRKNINKTKKQQKKNDKVVMYSLGIHPDFWVIVNEKNPLVERDSWEVPYFMKV